MLMLVILTSLSSVFIRSVFSHPTEVRNVVSEDVNGSVHLNITVWHDVETSLHYVDNVEVTFGTNTTSLMIGPQPLKPDGTFTFDYDLGQISDTPIINVRARCTISGYSGAVPWTGQIPEFSSIIILPLFMIAALFMVVLFKKRGAI
jgi:hypothetical protein